MKKIFFISFVSISFCIFFLCFTSCGPVDFFGKKIPLENVEYSIAPEKEFYSLSDAINLTYSFSLDSEKFYEYEYYISIYLSDGEWNQERLFDHILVYDESGEDVTNKRFSCPIDENTKITKNFTLIPKKTGNYYIFIGGYAYTRKKEPDVDSYYSGHIHYLNIR